MTAQTVDDVEVRGCKSCGGHFVDHDAMVALAAGRSETVRTSVAGYAVPTIDPHRVLACPVCSRTMKVGYVCHGCAVLVDICVPHGTWFDRLELESALDAIGRGARYHRPDKPPPLFPDAPAPKQTVPYTPYDEIAFVAQALAAAAERRDWDDVHALLEKLSPLAKRVRP
jgi:Zn-finger nucleic acid-binding protein